MYKIGALMVAVLAQLEAAAVNGSKSNAENEVLRPSDYNRALTINDQHARLMINAPEVPFWLADGASFAYRLTSNGKRQFVLVNVANGRKQAAFDHKKLASALNRLGHKDANADNLPFDRFELADDGGRISFEIEDTAWSCELINYACSSETKLSTIDQQSPYDDTPPVENDPKRASVSPDGKWLAYTKDYNLFLLSKEGSKEIRLTWDGSEGNYYAFSTLSWSPDSRRLAAYRVRPGHKREVHYIESSPRDQRQPRHWTMTYPKPGDALALPQPVLFDVGDRREIAIDNALFPNPYDLSPIRWWKDSRGFTFEYNERGHQLYRLAEVEAATGTVRTLIDERSKTFIDYQPLRMNQSNTGKTFRYDVEDGREIIWASERDGYEHLYLFDGYTGELKNQITRGAWVVRSVHYVDPIKRQIWFSASGMNKGEDPYFVHAYRINFDGTGLTSLTPERANHHVKFSPDGRYYLDLCSRSDLPPRLMLYRTIDNSELVQVESTDISALVAAGWQPPLTFHTKGRDGETEIWGIIHLPINFDRSRRYPVIEKIYAGPTGSFVPKSFSPVVEPLTQLGFVVVQIDGMGTNNRSRAFHDVAWKNLRDAGFPDRILWHKAASAEFSWYDISNVGIFGGSAGGQNAVSALLFHSDFYKVAVANSGCYDNRMDKIWWNEQWMGWPVGIEYSQSSSVDNAHRLQGKLLLIVGELDRNVDPSSTFQLADRLIRAGKYFDMLVVPGADHGTPGSYSLLKLLDFFVLNILRQTPPNWNDPSIGQPKSQEALSSCEESTAEGCRDRPN
ncbi:DPP IV N-terminal domain-containing protein [Bradyrhizobium sp. IC3069]|uniref:S9 family peptidase n=1 Tax=unclassified Bradyrhizobium TaxID=2631580 RepID=UPI001CD3C801|nr:MULTISPECIES: S9 family peptidase [unclassified Bradyrhizobium]MCA1360921.1 DPP IV N-terminal domain-containing protein [Bradyrhizobium sp. IC4059]MCA1518278.1 DPP IV N-terminal domain-containing protein [Bradyrhizobium sp. IC3069]